MQPGKKQSRGLGRRTWRQVHCVGYVSPAEKGLVRRNVTHEFGGRGFSAITQPAGAA